MSERPDIEAIQARCNAATPGPWEIYRYPHGGGRIHISGDDGRARELIADVDDDDSPGSVATAYSETNREFLFHARTDVPALLDEVVSLRAQLAAVEALAERWKRADGRGKHAARRSGALAAQLLTVLHAKDNDVARMLADPDAYFRILRAASRSSVETPHAEPR